MTRKISIYSIQLRVSVVIFTTTFQESVKTKTDNTPIDCPM